MNDSRTPNAMSQCNAPMQCPNALPQSSIPQSIGICTCTCGIKGPPMEEVPLSPMGGGWGLPVQTDGHIVHTDMDGTLLVHQSISS